MLVHHILLLSLIYTNVNSAPSNSVEKLIDEFVNAVKEMTMVSSESYGQNSLEGINSSEDKECDVAKPGGGCTLGYNKCQNGDDGFSYLTCTNVGWVVVNCPLGTRYNQEAMKCLIDPFTTQDFKVTGRSLPMQNIDRCSSVSPGDSCETANDKCTYGENALMYLVCSNAGWVAMACPLGTYYNKKQEDCISDDFDYLTEQDNENSVLVKTDAFKEPKISTKPEKLNEFMEVDMSPCLNANQKQECMEEQLNQRCPLENYPQRYLVCSNQGWVEMACPTGTWYNEQMNECNAVTIPSRKFPSKPFVYPMNPSKGMFVMPPGMRPPFKMEKLNDKANFQSKVTQDESEKVVADKQDSNKKALLLLPFVKNEKSDASEGAKNAYVAKLFKEPNKEKKVKEKKVMRKRVPLMGNNNPSKSPAKEESHSRLINSGANRKPIINSGYLQKKKWKQVKSMKSMRENHSSETRQTIIEKIPQKVLDLSMMSHVEPYVVPIDNIVYLPVDMKVAK